MADADIDRDVGVCPCFISTFKNLTLAGFQGGLTLLHYAALWGHVDTANALLDNGARFDAQDNQVFCLSCCDNLRLICPSCDREIRHCILRQRRDTPMLWPVYSSVVHRRYDATFHRPPSHALSIVRKLSIRKVNDLSIAPQTRVLHRCACWPSTAREYEYECVIGSFAVVKLWSHC